MIAGADQLAGVILERYVVRLGLVGLSLALLFAGATMAKPSSPPSVVSLPSTSQILAAYPPKAKAVKISGSATLICLISPKTAPQTPWCKIESETPAGHDFGLWGTRLAGALILFAPPSTPDQWREVTIEVSWTTTADGRSSGRVEVGAPYPTETPNLAPVAVRLPPGEARRGPPVDEQIADVGPCVWAAIGDSGQREFIAETSRGAPRFSQILAYHADWDAALQACDAGLGDKRRDTIMGAIGGYVMQAAYLSRLELLGITRERLESAAADAPVATRAAMRRGLVTQLRDPSVVWKPIFQPLGLSAAPGWRDGSPQALVVGFFKGRALHQEGVAWLSPTTVADRSRPISASFSDAGFRAPIAKPVWRRTPTDEELGKSFPTDALLAGVTYRVVLDCLANADGSLKTCRTRSESPELEDSGYSFRAWSPIELAQRAYALEPLDGDGRPVESATVRIEIVWPALQ